MHADNYERNLAEENKRVHRLSERSEILNADLKIILLDHQNNYVGN